MRKLQQNRSPFAGPTKGGSVSKLDLTASQHQGSPSTDSLPDAGGSAIFEAEEPLPAEFSAGAGRALPVPGWKRAFDIACVLLAAPLWLPVMVLIIGWIKMTSSGPVFFRQIRIGRGRRPFTMLKFRSMKSGADTRTHESHFRALVENDASMIKLDSFKDSRVIPGGRFLRSTGLDELPQLFNVLRGDMSLVGPRPCTPEELECYTGWQKARFNVLPGITGYWQVNGKNKTTFNQMIEMDIQYGKRMSLLFDLVIIIGTIPAMAMQAIEARWQAPIRASQTNETTTTSTDTVRLA